MIERNLKKLKKTMRSSVSPFFYFLFSEDQMNICLKLCFLLAKCPQIDIGVIAVAVTFVACFDTQQ